MKRIYKRHTAFAAVLTACCLCGGGLHAAAITVDDVAQKAREVGFPEEQVQLGYNYWASGEYTEKDLEEAYARLCEYDQQADDKIDDIFNNGGTVQPTQPAQTQPATQPPAQTGAAQTQPATQTPANSGTTAPAETQPASTTISSYDFIMMSLDEKIAYVNSMSPADKEAFLNNLTPGERNSIIKQMNVNDQAELLQGYIDAAKEMNMNIAVDSISAEGIAITVRDDEGTIIDKSATGITIDETGIAHDGLLAAAAIAVLLAAAGFALVYRHLCRTDGGVQ